MVEVVATWGEPGGHSITCHPPHTLTHPCAQAVLLFAEVLGVKNHPKADKLKICELDAGEASYTVRVGWEGGGAGMSVSAGGAIRCVCVNVCVCGGGGAAMWCEVQS